MKKFKYPANIRQIGNIDNELKIYVEDYVMSYLKQYLSTDDYDEQLCILLGAEMIIESQKVLFISGAIEGRYAEELNGIKQFTDKTWEYVLRQKENFFDDLEIVGFVQSQPGYGTYLNSNYANYHINNFKKPYQVLFVFDPTENTNAFFRHDKNMNELEEALGYFVYYDKNKNMHEYMLQSYTGTPSKVFPAKEDDKTMAYLSQINKSENKNSSWSESESDFDVSEYEVKKPKTKAVPPKKSVKKVSAVSKSSASEEKKSFNLLAGLNVALFILTFVMGMSLIKNEDRITLLENDLKVLSTSYRNILSAINDTTVFASSDETSVEYPEESENNNNMEATLIQENGNDLVADANANLTEEPKVIKDFQKEESVTASTIVENISPESSEPLESSENVIPEYYIVQQGDNLIQISLKFYGTRDMAKKIMEVNNMTDADKIYYGKKIKLP